jgi:threonine dehydrogenase-like Zn-dependent dehydrogenase
VEALEIVGGDAVPPVIQQCLDLLRPGGRLVILGYHYGQSVPIDPPRWSTSGSRSSPPFGPV